MDSRAESCRGATTTYRERTLALQHVFLLPLLEPRCAKTLSVTHLHEVLPSPGEYPSHDPDINKTFDRTGRAAITPITTVAYQV